MYGKYTGPMDGMVVILPLRSEFFCCPERRRVMGLICLIVCGEIMSTQKGSKKGRYDPPLTIMAMDPEWKRYFQLNMNKNPLLR